ncbi:ABC transporter permease [Alkaliphilus pronyensis]|uniref:ABC transporter permease n=1 Tax=Alkaliphilus pronyensis TaxID=1482732 RepID=A0A6I0F8L7_9FIRM|nr:ABC transporter permease [Alkaliphilus pronyensis]KAB3532384.1 ABC transporter permease [Alkaliphilus pronyensis]
MEYSFISLLKKDFKMMLSSKFLLLIVASLILYSLYINLVYIKIDQDIYPVYLLDPEESIQNASSQIIRVDNIKELQSRTSDGYAVGIDATGLEPEIIMVSSGLDSMDNIRTAYAYSLLSPGQSTPAEVIGQNSKEMKNRREITSEFLFFELAAVGFLGLASALFKEKHMGVIRVHGVMPVSKSLFIFSKLVLFLLTDLAFAFLLTIINLGLEKGISVLPAVLVQTILLSLIMALLGFLCAVRLPDFKQFSLLYLVLAIFITTPVFLVGQTSITWNWVNYNPMYHLFMAIKNAYFGMPTDEPIYYIVCVVSIVSLFMLAYKALTHEMAKEG